MLYSQRHFIKCFTSKCILPNQVKMNEKKCSLIFSEEHELLYTDNVSFQVYVCVIYMPWIYCVLSCLAIPM